jgi:hypothetical protein
LTLLALPAPAAGRSFAPKEFDQMVAEAEQIFVGTVAAADSWRLPAGLIVTDVTFATSEVLKGPVGGVVTLLMPGGTVEDETLKVSGLPALEVGATYLVFVRDNGSAIVPVVGGDQGLFRIARDPGSGRELALDARGKPIASETVRRALGQSGLRLEPAPPVALPALLRAIRDRVRPERRRRRRA